MNVGPILREELFQKTPSVIMTAPRFSTAGKFDFFRSHIGLTQPKLFAWAAPSTTAGSVILPADMPDPAENGAEYERRAVEMIRRYVGRAGGRASCSSPATK